ncbi:hypothetical protein JX265_008004 [Neoarthrinium moseri]|uniref:Clr5 domain-containing protein n=1 Tax=Neoarthrinium moseri TaxID=1658444 RepID=A0A9P9WIU6_9PEZI|nr:hypothetical protein JX265_008004 [Neoarthrinium moseri]
MPAQTQSGPDASLAPQPGESSLSIWQQHRQLFRKLYLEDKKTLKRVKEIAERDYGFPQTPLSTYETKLRDELGLKKKLKAHEWAIISQYIEAKATQPGDVLRFNGVVLPWRKVKKEIARNRHLRRNDGNLALPPEVTIGPENQNLEDRHDLEDAHMSNAPDQPSSPKAMSHFVSGNPGAFGYEPPIGSPGEMSFREAASSSAALALFANHGHIEIMTDHWYFPTEPASSSSWTVSSPTQLFPDIFASPPPMDAIKRTLQIMASCATAHKSSTVVIHPEFKDLWFSFTKNLPVYQLQSLLRSTCSVMPMVQRSSVTEHQDRNDGVLGAVHTSPVYQTDVPGPHAGEGGSFLDMDSAIQSLGRQFVADDLPDSQLSTSTNMFHALTTTLYYLSNHFIDLVRMEEIIDWLAHKISRATVRQFLQISSLTMQECWIQLIYWAFELNEKGLFEDVARAAMTSSDWVKIYGQQCLVLAASLNLQTCCRRLLEYDLDPYLPIHFQRQKNGLTFRNLGRVQVAPDRETPSRVRQSKMILAPTSPVIEAATKGHIEVLDVLLGVQTSVDTRCSGITPAGYTLLALIQWGDGAENLLAAMQVLLDKGADVDGPFREFISSWSSEETLFDVGYSLCQEKTIELLARYSKMPKCILSVSGLLASSELGLEELETYLRVAAFPRGLHRLLIQRSAVFRALDRPQTLITLLRAGFLDCDLNSNIRPKCDHDGPPQLNLYRLFLREVDSLKGLVLRHINTWKWLPDLHRVLTLLLKVNTAVLAHVSRECLHMENGLEYFLLNGLEVSGERGVSLLAEAARLNKVAEVSLLLRHGANVNGTIRQGKTYWPLLLLASGDNIRDYAKHPDLSQAFGYFRPAPINMLEHLVNCGADFTGCARVLFATSTFEQLITFQPPQLKWWLEHEVSQTVESISDVIIKWSRLHDPLAGLNRPSYYKQVVEIVRYLEQRNTPIFTGKAPSDSFSGKEVALANFIYFKCDIDFLSRAFNEIGINVPTVSWTFDGSRLRLNQLSCHEHGTNQCYTPLQIAIVSGDVKVVEELIRLGADVNEPGCLTALQVACGDRHHKMLGLRCDARNALVICQYLLSNGADPNACGHFARETPLDTALSTPGASIELIKLLLRYGAKVDKTQYNSCLSLDYALMNTHIGDKKRYVVEMLLQHGAEIGYNRRHSADDTFYLACKFGDIQIIKLFLDQGINVNPGNQQDIYTYNREKSVRKFNFPQSTDAPFTRHQELARSPLAVLAGEGDIPGVLTLLNAGATLTGFDNSLLTAVNNGRLDTVVLLMELETRESHFKFALQDAGDREYYAISTVLREHVAMKFPHLLAAD